MPGTGRRMTREWLLIQPLPPLPACCLQIEELSFLKIELHLTNTASKVSALTNKLNLSLQLNICMR